MSSILALKVKGQGQGQGRGQNAQFYSTQLPTKTHYHVKSQQNLHNNLHVIGSSLNQKMQKELSRSIGYMSPKSDHSVGSP